MSGCAIIGLAPTLLAPDVTIHARCAPGQCDLISFFFPFFLFFLFPSVLLGRWASDSLQVSYLSSHQRNGFS